MESQIMQEKEQTQEITVEHLGRMLYGTEGAAISLDAYRESAEFDPEIDALFWEIVKSGEAVTAVTDTDDGCIDGRLAVKVMFDGDGKLRVEVVADAEHQRAKVAGGGYMTGLAMRLGAGIRSGSVDDDITQTGETLAKKGIYCGAHNATHVHTEGGTGCGANDSFPLILHNALAFREGVEKTTAALLTQAGVEFDKVTFDNVLDNWEETISDPSYLSTSSGTSRLQRILNLQIEQSELATTRKPVAVTKELGGSHREIAIIANYLQGTTINQGAIAQKLSETFETKESFDAETLPQAFVVDAWRIVELAGAAVDETQTMDALYAGVMYQVATAATLTDGSLEMFSYK